MKNYKRLFLAIDLSLLIVLGACTTPQHGPHYKQGVPLSEYDFVDRDGKFCIAIMTRQEIIEGEPPSTRTEFDCSKASR